MGLPLVALGVQPIPQPDVLGNAAKLSQLRGQQQAQAIQAQIAPLETQQLQQQNQSGAIDLQNKMLLQKYFSGAQIGAAPGEVPPGQSSPTQSGPAPVGPSTSQPVNAQAAPPVKSFADIASDLGHFGPAGASLAKVYLDLQKDLDAHSTDLQDSAAKRSDLLGQAAYAAQQSLKGGADPSTVLRSMYGNLQQADPLITARIEGDIKTQGPQALPQLLQQYMNESPKVQEMLKSQTEAGAKALEAKYKIVNGQLVDVSGAQPKPVDYSGLKPSDWDSVVDSAVPPRDNPALNASTKAQVNFYVGKGNIEQAQKVLSDATGKVSQIDVETDPRVLAARAGETAQAATMVARARQAMYPSALEGVAPQLVAPATAAMNKSGEDYAKAVQTSQDLNELIAEAKGGNKAAVKIVPLQGALEITTAQGVHRINRTEVDQYGGAGSLLDHIEGRIGGVVSGKDIPDDVLNDMQAMQKMIAGNAQRLHENSVKTINSTYGSKFQPMSFDQQSGAGAPSGMTRIKASDGTLHDIPSANLERARKIDPNLSVVGQ